MTPPLVLGLAVAAVVALALGLVLRFTTDVETQVLGSLRLLAMSGGLLAMWSVGALTREGRLDATDGRARLASGLAALALFGAAAWFLIAGAFWLLDRM